MPKSWSTSSPKSKSSVQFSAYSDLLMFEDDEESRSRLNYSSAELDLLKIRAARDAQIMAMLIASQPPTSQAQIPIEALCRMVGVERIMPGNEVRRMRIRRRQNHVQAILSNQGSINADDLQSVSQESSGPARKVAQLLAAHYFDNVVV